MSCKLLVGAAAGIFVGAFAVELLNKLEPGTFSSIGSGFSKFASSLTNAFKSGYQGVAGAEPAAEPPATPAAAS